MSISCLCTLFCPPFFQFPMMIILFQVPQYILDDMILSGQGGFCNIICTQPRRIAVCPKFNAWFLFLRESVLLDDMDFEFLSIFKMLKVSIYMGRVFKLRSSLKVFWWILIIVLIADGFVTIFKNKVLQVLGFLQR